MPTVLDPRPPVRAPAPPRPARPSRLYHFDPLLGETSPDAGRFRRKLIVVSVALHVAGFIVLTILPSRARTISEPSLPVEIVLTLAPPKVPEFVPLPPAPKPLPKPEPRPVARERAPEPLPAPAPVPVPVPVRPVVEAAPLPKPAPPKPVPVVKTNVFGGVAVGPPVATGKTSRTVIPAFGDEVAPPTGAAARRGRVAEVGFDGASTESATRRPAAGTVKSGGFDTQAQAAPAPAAPKRERPMSRLDAEVEILSKPKPVYTEEARRLRIEGDVVLRVTFQANGRLLVQSVVSGLGHGLDEAAIAAAKKVEFNPARSDGQPVDHTANLRVVFRLA